MAIQALTDSETYFVARATPEDIREWKVGFFSTFRDQLLEINRALMAGDYSGVAPYVEDPATGVMKFPNYTDLSSITTDRSVGDSFVIDPRRRLPSSSIGRCLVRHASLVPLIWNQDRHTSGASVVRHQTWTQLV